MLPKRFPDRTSIKAVRELAESASPGEDAGDMIRFAGRVMAKRDLVKVVFLDLVDRTGRIQLFVPGTLAREAHDLHLGDIVGAIGGPGRTRAGEPSLFVAKLEPLARIRSPLPDTF